MGQAKQRGTKEQRIKQAIVKHNQELVDYFAKKPKEVKIDLLTACFWRLTQSPETGMDFDMQSKTSLDEQIFRQELEKYFSDDNKLNEYVAYIFPIAKHCLENEILFGIEFTEENGERALVSYSVDF